MGMELYESENVNNGKHQSESENGNVGNNEVWTTIRRVFGCYPQLKAKAVSTSKDPTRGI